MAWPLGKLYSGWTWAQSSCGRGRWNTSFRDWFRIRLPAIRTVRNVASRVCPRPTSRISATTRSGRTTIVEPSSVKPCISASSVGFARLCSQGVASASRAFASCSWTPSAIAPKTSRQIRIPTKPAARSRLRLPAAIDRSVVWPPSDADSRSSPWLGRSKPDQPSGVWSILIGPAGDVQPRDAPR